MVGGWIIDRIVKGECSKNGTLLTLMLRSGSCGLRSCVGLRLRSLGKWIPDALEAAVAEVLFVYGGEFGDALFDEDECGTPIVGAAAGEIGGTEFRPESVVEGAAVRREADDLPARVLAEGLADIGGGAAQGAG